jgi:hypothetical protein
MRNKIYEGFLRRQHEEGMRLAEESDVLNLVPAGVEPADRYMVELRCKGLVRNREGEIVVADQFAAGIWFPADYLRRADPLQIVTWLVPFNVFHPNISPPVVCLGRVNPGTSLIEIVYQLHDIVTYNKVTMREDDALNPVACAWARQNVPRFPIDRRPLKRRVIQFEVNLGPGSGVLESAGP